MTQTPAIKPRNAEKTKARILAAAFDLFGEHGYAKTGIRDIATQAEVASSLIARHFGSKAHLFEQCLIYGIHTHTLFVEDKPGFGQQMARMMVSKANPKLTTTIMLAIADPESKAIARKVTREHIMDPLAQWIGPPNAKARAISMLTLMNGFVLQTKYLSSDKTPPATIEWLAKALQDIVDNR